jgi:hypothetical protein
MKLQTAYDVYRNIGLRSSDQASLRTAVEKWRQRQTEAGNTGYESDLVENAEPKQVFINHGRWVIRCDCDNGVVTPPPQPDAQAICPSCGTIWTTLVFPDDADVVEATLTERPFKKNQNWEPGESVNDLQRENVERRR